MTLLQRRIIIAIDEWLGAFLCVYLYQSNSSAFWPVLIFWAIAVYGISYPNFWRREDLDAETKITTIGE